MPRTLAQNAQYIAETIKPAIKSAIEAQGVTVPSTDSFLDYADRIAEIEGGGSGYQLKDLPTGAISTVTDAAELPLNALKVSVEAWQEGSGDPSPSNVRPIHGWDSGEITVCDDLDNPTQTETITLDFPQTIYGAEWDVVDGPLDLTHYLLDNTNDGYLTKNIETADSVSFRIQLPFNDPIERLQDDYILCNKLRKEPLTESNTYCVQVVGNSSAAANNSIWFNLPPSVATTASEARQWIIDEGVQFVYHLANPQKIDLSPLSIRLLEGTNNVYADCGEVKSGEYFVDEGAIDVRKVDYSIGSNSTLKISDGRILQGFANMTSYHARPLDASGNWLDVDWSKDFEVCVAFKYTDSGASGITVLLGYNYDSALNSRFRSPLIYIDKDHGRDLCLEIGSNGSSWMVDQSLSYAIALDTWYALKLKFILSTLTLDCSISTDFDTWTSLYNNTLSSAPYHSNTSMIGIGGGCQASAWSSNGLLIDTFNTYIKGDGVNWGAFTGAFPN